MNEWPPIDERRARERLAMDDAEFDELALRLAQRVDGQIFTEEHFERATSYPWHPIDGGHGFVLEADGSSRPYTAADRSIAESMVRRDDQPVYPLIAIGSNASQETLAAKLADLENPIDRQIVALPAALNDVTIGFSAHLAVYGSLPATLVHRPGSRIAVTVLFVSAAQLARITDGEFNYLLARFAADAVESEIPLSADPLAFVSRHGAMTHDDQVMELRATPQADALAVAARHAIGIDASARDLVRATIESYEWAVSEARPRLRARAQRLDRAFWNLHPGG